MDKGIMVFNGKDVDSRWNDSLLIGKTVMPGQVQNLSATGGPGGSLPIATYCYVVTAAGAEGESAVSTEQSAASGGGNHTNTLTWDNLDSYSLPPTGDAALTTTNVSHFFVYRGTATGDYDRKFEVFTNSFTDNGLKTEYAYMPIGLTAAAAAGGSLADNTYYYTVTAITPDGESFPCKEASATTATTNNSVLLTWMNVPKASAYRVYRSLVSGTYSQCVTDQFNATYTDKGTRQLISTNYPSKLSNISQEFSAIKYSVMKKITAVFLPDNYVNGELDKKQSYIQIELDDKNKFNINLMQVINQSTWSVGTQASTMVALADIEKWKANA